MQLGLLLVCGRVKWVPQSWVLINGLHQSYFLDRVCTGWSEAGKYLMHWSTQSSLDDVSCSLFTLTPGTKAQSPMTLFCLHARLALPPQAWAPLTRHRPRWLTLPLPVLEVRTDESKWRVKCLCRHSLNLATPAKDHLHWKTLLFLFWSCKCLFKNCSLKKCFSFSRNGFNDLFLFQQHFGMYR